MTFEVWRTTGSGKASAGTPKKIVTTGSWALANFFARLVSLTGQEALIICDQCFDGEPPGSKTPVATYQLGRLLRLFAGAPGVPSIWP
jgi:hypothetical protein